MVDITNGRVSLTVTKGAFEGIYKHQGYTLVHDYSSLIQVEAGETVKPNDNNSIIEKEEVVSDNLEKTGESDETEGKKFERAELLETPIGQWSKEELKEFAEANNISIDGASTVREVRNIIKDFINQ